MIKIRLHRQKHSPGMPHKPFCRYAGTNARDGSSANPLDSMTLFLTIMRKLNTPKVGA